jgi:hypothetical protein
MDKSAIAAELLRRGVAPDEIARRGFPEVAQMGRTGMIAPRLDAPDKVALRSAYVKDYDKLSKRREDLGRYYETTSNLDRFHTLNHQTGTGGILNNIPFVKDAVEALNPSVREMSGIASGLQGKARPAGSGATSDFEQRLYRQGVPSPEKPGPVNESIINYQKGVLAEESDRTAFDEEFMRRNGSLSGSQEAWARYVARNPYTVSDPHGHARLNPNRADWRVHFGLQKPQPKAAPGGDPLKGIRQGQIVEQGGQRYKRVGNQMVPVK